MSDLDPGVTATETTSVEAPAASPTVETGSVSTSTESAPPSEAAPLSLRDTIRAKLDEATGKAATAVPPKASGVPAPAGAPVAPNYPKEAVEHGRKQAQAEFERKYGWAAKVDPNEFQQIGSLARQLAGNDLGGFLRNVLGQLPANELQGLLREFGATPARAEKPATEDPEPSLFVERNGQLFYDPAQQQKWRDWNERKTLAKVNDLVKPLQDRAAQSERAESEAAQQREAQQFLGDTVTYLKTLPHFEAHSKEIGVAYKTETDALFARAQQTGQIPTNDQIASAALRAYMAVVPSKLESLGEAKARQSLTAKAKASSASPNTSGRSQPSSPDKKGEGGKALRDAIAAKLAASR